MSSEKRTVNSMKKMRADCKRNNNVTKQLISFVVIVAVDISIKLKAAHNEHKQSKITDRIYPKSRSNIPDIREV